MALYQLCREKSAEHPFYIEHIDVNIYTIEELCFFFKENLCLLDESILNEELCDWLEEELGMKKLAFRLREKLEDAESISQLVIPVFREIGYLNTAEYRCVQEEISRLEIQPEEIRKKTQADFLAEYGMYNGAIRIYRQILQNRTQGKLGIQFYANIFNNMAGAYGRMFLFREAAQCLWQSYELVRSNAVYKSYLALLPLYLTQEEYEKRLTELCVPKEQIQKIEKEKEEILQENEKYKALQEADRTKLLKFLNEEKNRYHKSKR